MRYWVILCALLIVLTGCDDKKSKKSRSSSNDATETTATESTDDSASSSAETTDRSEDPSSSQGDAREEKKGPAADSTNGLKPVPDNSLTIAEYKKLKVPDPGIVWQANNYKFAAAALTQLAKDDFSKLPRADSPKSGKFFARIVAAENIDFLRSRQITFKARLQRHHELFPHWKAIQDLYLEKLNQGHMLDVEVTQLLLFGVESQAAVLAALDASATPNDQQEEGDEDLSKGVIEVLTKNTDITLRNLKPETRSRSSQRLLLAKGVQKHWATFFNHLPDDQRGQTRATLEQMVEHESNPQIKQLLKNMAEYRAADKSEEKDTSPSDASSGSDTGNASDKTAEGLKKPIKPVPDHSLTVEEYMKLKVPDPARIWQGSNYEAAFKVLKKLAEEDLSKLPRVDSPKSGKLFARLVSLDNLKALRNRDLALQFRFSRAEALGNVLEELSDLYVEALNNGSQFDAEVVQISLFGLDILSTSLILLNDYIESLPPDAEERNPNSETWQGLDELRQEILDKHLKNLDPDARLRPAQRILMAEGTLKRWPEIMDRFPDNLRNEYRDRLTKLVETEPVPQVKAALKKMIEYKPAEKQTK